MDGSKHPIEYGVMVHRNRNWSPGLRFESLLFSEEKNKCCLSKVTSGIMDITPGVESGDLGSSPNRKWIMKDNLLLLIPMT